MTIQIKGKELQGSKAANERAEDVGCKRARIEKEMQPLVTKAQAAMRNYL
jgi:hypothetical protein